jgi:hypothetical protein
MKSEDFTIDTALDAAKALEKVLASRVHRKKMWGQEVIIPGQLGKALRLPTIIAQLSGKIIKRRQKGLTNFQELWDTLSHATKKEVLNQIGWYNPKELDWEDKRSNKRPQTEKD